MNFFLAYYGSAAAIVVLFVGIMHVLEGYL